MVSLLSSYVFIGYLEQVFYCPSRKYLFTINRKGTRTTSQLPRTIVVSEPVFACLGLTL